MNILLVYPEFGGVSGIHHGLTSLSAILKAHGHNVSLFIWNQLDMLDGAIKQKPFDVVAFSLMETHENAFRKVWETTLRFLECKIYIGGPAAVLFSDLGVDHIFIGEADQRIDFPDQFPKIVYGNYPDLDLLPPEDLSLFPLTEIIAKRDGQVELMLGRGCGYNCAYCINGGITHKKGYIRMKPLVNIMSEILAMKARPDVTSIYFIDDDFLIYWKMFPERFVQFLEWYEVNIHLPFLINCSPQTMDKIKNHDNPLMRISMAGCTGIRIGIEAVEHLRQEILNRPISDAVIEHCVQAAHSADLEVGSYNMIGLPTESPADVIRLLFLNVKWQIDYVKVMFFYPFRNTPIFDEYKDLIDLEKRATLTDYESDSCLRFSVEHLVLIQYLHENLAEILFTLSGDEVPYTIMGKSLVKRERV
jgi:radical SAM superfamily enzyme YgiQ (UPF0313 family)